MYVLFVIPSTRRTFLHNANNLPYLRMKEGMNEPRKASAVQGKVRHGGCKPWLRGTGFSVCLSLGCPVLEPCAALMVRGDFPAWP